MGEKFLLSKSIIIRNKTIINVNNKKYLNRVRATSAKPKELSENSSSSYKMFPKYSKSKFNLVIF